MDTKLQWWLKEYSESHQNPINKTIHYFCVPAIVISLSGLLWCIPLPSIFPTGLNCCSIAMFLSLFFYLSISIRHTIYISIFFIICYSLIWFYSTWSTQDNLLYSNIIVFVLAWVAQFIGHVIEGKKPSFMRDLQFLLIGPLWIIDHLVNKFKISKKQ